MGKIVTDVGFNKHDNKRELKKHAATIHCSNALSLLQRKISNALLYHAYHELMQKEEHAITVKQLCRLIGYQGHNHAAIKDALKGLISTVIEWNVISDETGAENWTASSIIASVSLEGPNCYYAYSPRMKLLLHSPSMFGKIDLVIQSQFRSSYGLALYENCIRYRGLPHTKWVDMATFKKLMGVSTGVYDVFRDFKRRVLDKAVIEVNTYSDLIIEPECLKEGRKVVKVRFKLKERSKKTRLGVKPKEEVTQTSLQAQLGSTFGLTANQINQVLTDYAEQYVEDKIQLILHSKPYQTGKVQNRAAYLLSALKHDYQDTQSVVNFEDAKREATMTMLTKEGDLIEQQYQSYREKALELALAALAEAERNALIQRFTATAHDAIESTLRLQRRKYTRETVMSSPRIQAMLRQYILQELAVPLATLDEFVDTLSDHQQQAWLKLKLIRDEKVI